MQSLQENMFVPRKSAKDEGDGYVMAIASNYESMTSDLVIADAQKMEEGVIATVKLPFRLRSGTHTQLVPGRRQLPPVQGSVRMKLPHRSPGVPRQGAGFAAGAVVATSLVPLSVVHALPSRGACR